MTTKQTTTAQEDAQNEVLIQEALASAVLVEVPSDLKANPVIHRGDNELESPMTVKELSSAGYVYLYDTETREKSVVLTYMAPSKLRLKRSNGQPYFTATKPAEEPWRGTLKCMLHPDQAERAHYDDMGLPSCQKSNLRNPRELTRHMQKRHKQSWETIQKEKEDKEKAEDRDIQRQILLALAKSAASDEPKVIGTPEAPLYVSDKQKK